MFELVNGFRKTMYWSKAQMLAHADKYAPAFYKDAGKVKTKYGEKQRVSYADYEAGNYDPRDSWMYSSFWYKNFDGMAYKTMLRQLISKWGVMSIDLQKAFEGDMATLSQSSTMRLTLISSLSGSKYSNSPSLIATTFSLLY